MSSVHLVWSTPGAEQLIVQMARVSSPENADNMETAPRLLKYLINHKHWSPFEMANMCVKISTERDIAAQIIRHKSISFQEYSTRYSEAQEISLPTFRRQDHKNRQNSFNDLEPELISSFVRRSSYLLKDLRDLYNEMIEADVAKETARRILPLCTKTTMYANASLRSWIHYLQVRTDLSTQQEHRGIADMIKLIFEGQFPIIAEAAFGPTSAV
jgi:thymidylate synthase (FAD)